MTIEGAALKYVLSFDIADPKKRVAEMERSLNGLKSATAGAASSVLGAALGPFAGGMAGLAGRAVGPIGDFFSNNLSGMWGALSNNPFAQFTGGGGLMKDMRSAMSDVSGTNEAQKRFLGFVGNWKRETGQSMADQMQKGIFGLMNMQEQDVQKELNRAADNSFRESTYGPFNDGLRTAYENPSVWEAIKKAGELGYWNFRR